MGWGGFLIFCHTDSTDIDLRSGCRFAALGVPLRGMEYHVLVIQRRLVTLAVRKTFTAAANNIHTPYSIPAGNLHYSRRAGESDAPSFPATIPFLEGAC